ncbi:phage neck terminator protein [Lactiplantibacillus mudanjiangensis]|uniref:Phage neck terminator protein gp12-like domain-containing protein n=1 Tax=Lactiplantibacillus mudanjiangensis TaxID=1296538 RepID=A0A660DVZ9_9LACO|nr:hypothetical protein [Lactiplantibacillus mudanjiangensis]VDG23668.1 hypothetical protein MUDAN_IGPPGNFN_02205 [Lactiplantibacillus mudanjiangensis]VDG27811.1 hypothetical protein MUDAN_MDHGFNIF_02634 [Lactiplantibacillus mudanjiangensis]
MISKDAVFDYPRFFNTLIQITKDQLGLPMLNQENTGEPPQFPYCTFHLMQGHQRVTSDVIHGHRESMIIPVSLTVHAQYSADGAQYGEMLLMAFQSQTANYALHEIECGIQTFSGVFVQNRSVVIGGMTYDHAFGFDLNFTAMNPYVEDTGAIDHIVMNKDKKDSIDIKEESDNGNN